MAAVSGNTFKLMMGWMRKLFTVPVPVPAPVRAPLQPVPRAYLVRKRSLPKAFSTRDWDRALEYWGHSCAICGRPRGLWHTLAQDHWISLTHPDCPGTVPTNILPLCHGEDGCNNSKGKKEPEQWLVAKLGKRRARRKLQDIAAYFAWVHEKAPRRLGCPLCGGPVRQDQDRWTCLTCGADWDDMTTYTMVNCPTCQCWMACDNSPQGYSGGQSRRGYFCPRCAVTWDDASLPEIERCPSCERGVLEWISQAEGYWCCHYCGAEWVDA